jgi:SAM-dependent methyltransferase
VLTVDFAKFPIQPGEQVLDLGCGFGRHAFEAYRRGANVVAVDRSADEVAEVTAMFRAMAEIARVVRPGGRVAVTVPRYWPERVCWALSDDYHDVAGGHVRIYRGDVLAERLLRAGLTPTGTHHAHALHSPYWWLNCALGKESLPSRAYHRLLVWDIMRKPVVTRAAERALNPVLGKSLVMYADKPAAARSARVAA